MGLLVDLQNKLTANCQELERQITDLAGSMTGLTKLIKESGRENKKVENLCKYTPLVESEITLLKSEISCQNSRNDEILSRLREFETKLTEETAFRNQLRDMSDIFKRDSLCRKSVKKMHESNLK
jgi:hypothetical protein